MIAKPCQVVCDAQCDILFVVGSGLRACVGWEQFNCMTEHNQQANDSIV